MDVGTWLRDLGFEDYVESFAENGVDAKLLPDLTFFIQKIRAAAIQPCLFLKKFSAT